MKTLFYTPLEVSDGLYTATITDICEVGNGKAYILLEPFDGESIYAEVKLWLSEKCSTKSVTYQFFKALGITSKEIDTDNLKRDFLKAKVGIEIKDNIGKNGDVYHNIIRFFKVDEDTYDMEYEDDEDLDDEEDELEEDDEAEFEEAPKSTFRSKRTSRNSQSRSRR